MTRVTAASLLALLALCAGGWTLASKTAPVIADLATDYRQLQLVTPEPIQVNPEFALLCVGASQAHVDAARKTHGPHAHTSIRIYMDASAAKAFEAGSTPYPVGAVIVKEKLLLSYRTGPGQSTPGDRSGVGGMVKRDAGFDPEHGDWEYFYFEDPKQVESGAIASCVDCHASAKAKDHVFGNWPASR